MLSVAWLTLRVLALLTWTYSPALLPAPELVTLMMTSELITLLLVPLILPDARLLLSLLLREPPRHDRHSHLVLGLLLQTTRFGCQCSPPRLWIRMANRRFSQNLEIALSTPLLRPARAFDITLIFPTENCTVRSFNFFHTATFRHRLALT